MTQIRNSFNNEMESYAIALTKAKVREEYVSLFATRTNSDEIVPFIFFFFLRECFFLVRLWFIIFQVIYFLFFFLWVWCCCCVRVCKVHHHNCWRRDGDLTHFLTDRGWMKWRRDSNSGQRIPKENKSRRTCDGILKKLWFPLKSERGAREPKQVVYLNFLIITSSRIVSFFFHLNCRGIELDVSK